MGDHGLAPAEHIGGVRRTQGSETSQYLQEEKSTEIPPVAASDRGAAQTAVRKHGGVVGRAMWDRHLEANGMGRPAREGDSPVGAGVSALVRS